MSPSVDTVFSQFMCCTARFKGENSQGVGEQGGFPFGEGPTVLFSELPPLTEDAVMATSRSGNTLVINTLSDLIFFRLSASASLQADSIKYVRRVASPGGSSTFFPYVNISENGSRVSTICESSENKNAVFWSISTEADEISRYEFPDASGKVTCACSSGSGMIAGTDEGMVVIWKASEKSTSSFRVRGIASAVVSDSNFVFIAIKGCLKVFSIHHFEEVASVDLPDSVVGPITSMVRPSGRSVVSPRSSASGSVFFVAGGVLGQVTLDSKQIVIDSHSLPANTRHLFYGPFDNGPVMTITSSNELLTWETGYCLRTASRFSGKGTLVCASVSCSREFPRVLIASISIGGQLAVTSFGLRAAASSST